MKRKDHNKIFKDNDQGNTAVEFAFLAPAFFLVFMAIFEMGAVMLVKTSLETAILQVSRFGRTGDTVTGQTPQQTATALATQYSFGLVDPTQVKLMVTPYSSFSAMPSLSSLTSAQITNTQNFGASSQPVLYILSYDWPFFTPLVGQFFPNNKLTIKASAVVQNEPY